MCDSNFENEFERSMLFKFKTENGKQKTESKKISLGKKSFLVAAVKEK